MNTYTHYGVEVTRQIIDKAFKSVLKKAGCQYTELAIDPETDVIKYTKDGQTKYALICPLYTPDDYAEAVYITSQTPDDCNWELLRDDIEQQAEGKEPMERKTRLAMLIKYAEKNAFSIMGKEESDFNIFASFSPQIEEDKLISLVKTYLAAHGVLPQNVKDMEHYDISDEFMDKYFKA